MSVACHNRLNDRVSSLLQSWFGFIVQCLSHLLQKTLLMPISQPSWDPVYTNVFAEKHQTIFEDYCNNCNTYCILKNYYNIYFFRMRYCNILFLTAVYCNIIFYSPAHRLPYVLPLVNSCSCVLLGGF